MPMPAARIGDMHVCPMITGVVPHVGGPILPPCAPTVLIGGIPAARMGDLCTCVGPPDVIVRGSAGVLISGQPAARMLDNCVHGGVIILGCPTVLIGDGGAAGGAGGATMSPAAARGVLGAAAFPGPQSFGNCGIQSSGELIFLATGQRVGENDLLNEALGANLAGRGNPGDPASIGGSSALQRRQLLARHGVDSTIVPTSRQAMGDAIRNGQGVIVNVDAGTLWGNDQHGGHAVVVTDGTFDAHGNLDTVTVNDTGSGERHTMPADQLMNAAAARDGGSQMNVTNNPVFPH